MGQRVKANCLNTILHVELTYLWMHRFVLFETDSVPEGFAADFTRKWPCPAVWSADMNL